MGGDNCWRRWRGFRITSMVSRWVRKVVWNERMKLNQQKHYRDGACVKVCLLSSLMNCYLAKRALDTSECGNANKNRLIVAVMSSTSAARDRTNSLGDHPRDLSRDPRYKTSRHGRPVTLLRLLWQYDKRTLPYEV